MIERIGISLDSKLLRQFDKLIGGKGYSNRSEAVRDMIRDRLLEAEWKAPRKGAVAIAILVYEHHRMDLSDRLARLEHSRFRRIVGTLHVHLDAENCLEIIVMRGPGREIQRLGETLIGLRGVKLGRFIPATTGRHG